MIECRTMAGAERLDAYALMKAFRSDEAALGDALALFVDRPDYGFVWLAYDDGIPAACVSVSFAISTSSGGLIAQLRDLWVVPERRRRGIGSALLATLHGRLDQLDVTAIEATLPPDAAIGGFFLARGYAVARAAEATLARR
ncbi:MAG TPA: GNAT family N-acetyltransferase [Candidatus Limnocylindria bacterium]|jgi:GNAT superfamily N-acetyltransferase|nr:GNAT family N-acetyltransferase [Candidatus Limnocylindria bacterium]